MRDIKKWLKIIRKLLNCTRVSVIDEINISKGYENENKKIQNRKLDLFILTVQQIKYDYNMCYKKNVFYLIYIFSQ